MSLEDVFGSGISTSWVCKLDTNALYRVAVLSTIVKRLFSSDYIFKKKFGRHFDTSKVEIGVGLEASNRERHGIERGIEFEATDNDF